MVEHLLQENYDYREMWCTQVKILEHYTVQQETIIEGDNQLVYNCEEFSQVEYEISRGLSSTWKIYLALYGRDHRRNNHNIKDLRKRFENKLQNKHNNLDEAQ